MLLGLVIAYLKSWSLVGQGYGRRDRDGATVAGIAQRQEIREDTAIINLNERSTTDALSIVDYVSISKNGLGHG